MNTKVIPDPIFPVDSLVNRREARESLRETYQQIAEARDHVQRLQSTIEQAEWFLAPIRPLTSEILSFIFIECSRLDWKMPLTLITVSRMWRSTALQTASLWTHLKVSPTASVQFVQLWVRCASTPLHLSVRPRASTDTVNAALLHTETTPIYLDVSNNWPLLVNMFPNLETLRIGRDERNVEDSPEISRKERESRLCALYYRSDRDKNLLNPERFPKLSALHLDKLPSDCLRRIVEGSFFPPLQELHLHIGSSYVSLSIIELAAQNLIKLSIAIDGAAIPAIWGESIFTPYRRIGVLSFPRLVDLSILGLLVPMSEYYMKRCSAIFTTPVLDSYNEKDPLNRTADYKSFIKLFNMRRYSDPEPYTFPIHFNVGTVTRAHLDGDRAVDWSKFRSLKNVVICKTLEDALENIEALKDPTLCPLLERIELRLYGSSVKRGQRKKKLAEIRETLKLARDNVLLDIPAWNLHRDKDSIDTQKYALMRSKHPLFKAVLGY